MSLRLYDAHIHLAADRLRAARDSISSAYTEVGLSKAIVVGTSPKDWANVVELAAADERLIPAVGLHPWRVHDAPDDWQTQMLGFLDGGVGAIGELGLDQWIEGYDIEKQTNAFRWQLSIAAERNLPTSIHCLKAHEPLLETFRSTALPARGFKIHAYNGPVDTMKPLLDFGAHFSFNSGQLKPNAKRVREIIRFVPDDRILVETDAPDFLPPPELREFEFPATEDSRPPISHPGNIRAGYKAIAELRGCSYEELAQNAEANFTRYFLDEPR